MSTIDANPHIDVIATTISGSIEDWNKVSRIVPLFAQHGFSSVSLRQVDSHKAARAAARDCAIEGGRILISAGGSGTFNAVLEGTCHSGVPPEEITLGFLRKGSADLIGKVLGMPDEIESAIEVFAGAIRGNSTVPCDILTAEDAGNPGPVRHFAGYAGAEIFGMIPTVTENPLTKYYKGILSQFLGDLGPFFVGASLSSLVKVLRTPLTGRRQWSVSVDGNIVGRGRYQAFIVVNGDLGKDLPLARGVQLGSRDFHLFALRDLGYLRLPGQFKHVWNASILEDPARWGLEAHRVTDELLLRAEDGAQFRANVDGSTFPCTGGIRFGLGGRINLYRKAG